MVKKIKEVYRCNVCGNIVEVLTAGGGQLVCCGQDMELLKDNETDAALEKHVPVVEIIEDGYRIKIGEIEHPMTRDHFIEWISLETENMTYRKFLKSSEKPVAEFKTKEKIVKAKCYCNLHSLWQKKA
jgi:superoxide reductase